MKRTSNSGVSRCDKMNAVLKKEISDIISRKLKNEKTRCSSLKRRRNYISLQFQMSTTIRRKMNQTEIKLKSLILAQIERWRHA